MNKSDFEKYLRDLGCNLIKRELRGTIHESYYYYEIELPNTKLQTDTSTAAIAARHFVAIKLRNSLICEPKLRIEGNTLYAKGADETIIAALVRLYKKL